MLNSPLNNSDFSKIPKSLINPLLLNTLQQIYTIKSKVLGGTSVESLNLDFFNNFSDGRGVNLMTTLDTIYCIEYNKKLPIKQYEFLNTSYLDSIYITSVLEGHILIKEMEILINTFKSKEDSLSDEAYKTGRNNGPFIEMQAKRMFSNWREYLTPYVEILKSHLEKLLVIPLGSEINVKIENINESFLKELKEKEKLILKEINKIFSL